MNDNAIKNFATWARRELLSEVSKKCSFWGISDGDCPAANADSIDGRVLTSLEKRQRADLLKKASETGLEQLVETAAYTWFNRLLAIRFMEVNDRLPSHVRVLSGDDGSFSPQVLREALDLPLDALDGARALELVQAGDDEALFKLIFLAQCDQLAECMPAVFDRIGSSMELLLPDGLLRKGGVVEQLVTSIPEDDWMEGVEIIGWMYQYYVSERKDEVFASFKKGKKAERDAIAPATQLFTPNWIVRYLTENSLGRLWVLNHPESSLPGAMPYFISPGEDAEKEFKRISSPEEISVVDPACGSGHILVYAFDLLAAIYAEAGYSDREAARLIVEKNISGLEIDPRAAAMASFAVTMKACELDSRFLRRGVNPRITVLSRVEFTSEEKALMPRCRENLQLLDAAAHLDECGSLFKPSSKDMADIERDLASLASASSLFAASAIEKLERLQAMLKPLAARYDVVVANPPYMGSSNMNKWLADWTKRAYPDSKRDLCTCFIERGQNLAIDRGYEALITSDTCMYISSFEQLRKNILSRSTIVCFIDTRGTNAHPDVFDANAGWVLHNAFVEGVKGSYFKLNQAITAKDAGYLEALANPDCGWLYLRSGSDYAVIDGAPIAYWLSPGYYKLLSKKERMEDSYEIGSGLSTSDNERFLRRIWEVSFSKISSGKTNDAKWSLFQKGGSFRKWYGNLEYVVNWENDGEDIKYWVTHNPKDPNTKVWSRRIFNTHLYFEVGITWSLISSDEISFRFLPAQSMISNAAGGVFGFKNRDELLSVLGALNSSVHTGAFKVINPTINFSSGVVQGSPLCEIVVGVPSIVEENIDISKTDWDAEETSYEFKRHPLL